MAKKKRMGRKELTCRHPDRDEPKLMCGYPLPCPWHTAVIDTTTSPPTVTIPITADAAWRTRDRLAEIAMALERGDRPHEKSSASVRWLNFDTAALGEKRKW